MSDGTVTRTDVLLVGAVTLDELAQGKHIPGGSVLYASKVYAGMGLDVGVCTRAGSERGWDAEFAPAHLFAQPSRASTRFANVYDDDGGREQTLLATTGEVSSVGTWPRTRALHLTPVFNEVDVRSWTSAVDSELCVLNLQGWLRRADTIPGPVRVRVWSPEEDTSLEGVDAIVASTEDLLGQGDLLERLRRAVARVVITNGSGGCEVYEGASSHHVSAYPTRRVVDPTGAGDVFSAGFVTGLLEGASAVEAARLGCASASVVIEGVGASALERVERARARVAHIEVS